MFQIPVGTCIPGAQAKSWLPALKDKDLNALQSIFT